MSWRQGPAGRGRIVPALVAAVAWATACGWGELARGQAAGPRPPARDAGIPAGGESADEANERRAAERFLALLERSPRRGTALDRVYGFHVERGTLDGLVQGFRDRAGKDPKDGAAWMVLGLLESQRGRDAAAVEAFRRAEAARPDDPIASYDLGQSLALVGDNDGAAAALERAIDRKPRRADLLEVFQALGRIYQRAQKPDKALAVWNRLEALFPADLRVQEQAASALAEEGQLDQALARFETLAQKATDPFRRVEFAAQAADLKARLGRPGPALRDYEAILGRLRPDSWLFREVRRKVEDVFLRNDDQAGLAAYYEAWVGKNPEDVEAHVRLARTLQDLGRAADSRRWYDKAVALAPTRRDLRLALVAQFEHEGKFAEAAEQYAALDKADPNNPDTLRDWGGLLLRDASRPEAARAPAAKAVWRRLLDARPADPVTAAQVADLYRQAGLVEDALALYRKASELAPGNPQYVEYLGEYLHTLKRADEAQAAWARIADGPNKTPRNLARLGEVLAGFGYTRQAVEPTRQAVALEGDDFTLRLKFADLLFKVERYDDALAQLAEAGRLAEKDEEKAAVLDAELKTDQASGKLAAKAEALARSVAADPAAATDSRLKLARYQEADGKLPEAVRVVEAAVAADPRSTPAWALAARLREANGDLKAAADAFRRLAEVDRRNRTEYLTGVAKLEARLGRPEQALEAGRDLIAAAPGNPEAYQFFADLCFQLNRQDEGLDALRRAARVNPNDTRVVLTLAESLAGQFRTDEAIEMFWRAFDKADGLDAKLGVVPRLADLHLQINQFDRLLARLRRQDQEAGAPPTPQQQREQSICLAQAHASSGDIGAARSELERLLAANARDTQLLQQLSKLAEEEGDLESAARYQKQLAEVVPGEEQTSRLAQLYARAGEVEEAQALWSKLAEGQKDPAKVFATIDSLLGNDRARPALDLAENLVRKDPHDWEALYRGGVALAALDDREGAARRFRAVLDQKGDDDAPGAQTRARTRDPKLQGAGARTSLFARTQADPLLLRTSAAYQIRAAAKIDSRNVVSSQAQTRTIWAPADFGQARMAALGWLYALSLKEGAGRDKALVDGVRAEAEKPGAGARALWDWYYLCLVRQDNKAAYEAARALARSPQAEPPALVAYFRSLASRTSVLGARTVSAVDAVPPLPAAEVDEMLAAFATLRRRRPDLVAAAIVIAVDAELRRAGRDEDRARFFREVVDGAEQPAQLSAAVSLAASRPDVDALLASADRLERATSAQRLSAPGNVAYYGSSTYFAQAMGKLAEAKDTAGIVRVLDHYLAGARRRHDELAGSARGRSRIAPSAAMGASSSYVTVYGGGVTATARGVQVPFPSADSYLDAGAIMLLRNAYEAYKKADLASDLVAHVRGLAEAAKAPEDAIYPRLALGALLWWEDDKDAALVEYAKGVEATRADPEMTLKLADLYQQMGEPAEALARLDAVRPSDNATLQRREEAALRLAVQTGQVDRAREAAERLFGLRLDADAQLRLSEQMHQLGMHEAAEALLARSRRRAGNKATALVGLMLQYQRQGKNDVAAQVALQILRSSSPTRQANATAVYSSDAPDAARAAALQVLARSGKLDDLIRKTEEQAQRTPGSSQVRITLADYLTAANKRDRARDELKKLAEIRPDDIQLRLRIAASLAEQGQVAEALPHYEFALKKDPALLARSSSQMMNAYRRANRTDDLLALIEKADLRAFGQSYQVLNLMQNLTFDGGGRTQDPGRTARMMGIFKKLWEAFPAERSNMFSYFSNDQFWRSPEMYDYALQSFLPDLESGASLPANPWSLFELTVSYSSDGTITSGASRVLDMAAAQGKLGDLGKRIEALVQKLPDWPAGRAMLGMIRCREGRFDDAKERLKPVLAMKDSEFNSPYPTWVIAAELDKYAETQPLGLAFFEKSAGNRSRGYSSGESGPLNRLVQIYTRDGRKEDARRVILESAKPPEASSMSSQPDYEAQMKVQALTTAATKLVGLGFVADAAPLFIKAAEAADAVPPGGPNYIGNLDTLLKQARDGLANSLAQLKAEDRAAMLARLVEPPDPAKARGPAASPGRGGPGPGIDLVLMVVPRELDKAAVRSLYADAVSGLAGEPRALGDLLPKVEALAGSRPDDLPAQVAAALAALASGDRPRSDAALDRLDTAEASHPLEALPPGAAPNARQRAEAAARMTLWLVARACSARPGDDPARRKADRYADRALEAAGRQTDERWLLAMLREQGQWASDRGDSPAAEAAWGRMLDRIIKPEPRRKAPPAPAGPATPGGATTTTPMPTLVPPPTPTGGGVVRPISYQAAKGKAARPAGPMPSAPAQAPGAGPAGPPARSPSRGEPGVPVLTIDRFDRAMQVARLAASNGQAGLSLRAVREALRGGPPVEAVAPNSNASRTVIVRSGVSSEPVDAITPRVVEHIAGLDALWQAKQAPAGQVYEALRDVVLPAARPTEVFLYAMGFGNAGVRARPRSVGALAAAWAVRAGKADEFRAAALARKGNPAAELPAGVLAALVALASADDAATDAALKALLDRARRDTLRSSAELVCHVALPALDRPAAQGAALDLLDLAARGLESPNPSSSGLNDPSSSLNLLLARQALRRGDRDGGRKRLTAYMEANDRQTVRYGGDYAVYLRKQTLASVAAEYARAGLADDLLASLGEFADAPTYSGGDPPIGASVATLARLLAGRPAGERFEALRAWTLPTGTRRLVRLLGGIATAEAPPADFRTLVPGAGAAPEPGPKSTAGLLVEAARESGALDRLAADLASLAEAKEPVENARELARLVAIARGQGESVRPQVEARLAKLEEPVAPPTPGMSTQDFLAQGRPGPAQGFGSPDYLVAHALLRQDAPALRALGRRYYRVLGRQPSADFAFAAQVRYELLESLARDAGATAGIGGGDGGLRDWQATSPAAPASSVPPAWVAHQGHVAYAWGPPTSTLYYDLPLGGTYEFSVDASAWAGGSATILLGGEPIDAMRSSSAAPMIRPGVDTPARRPMPARDDGYTRLTVQAKPGSIRYLADGRLLREDTDPSPTSPWLGLVGRGSGQAAWKNLRLAGQPTIPREVPLSYDDRLEGWNTDFFGETRGPRVAGRAAAGGSVSFSAGSGTIVTTGDGSIDPDNFDWIARDGVISGRKVTLANAQNVFRVGSDPFVMSGANPSRIAYARPLRDGEEITYEFLYQPGQAEVHPSLGRLAFLLDRPGVRLHWMTAVAEAGLPADNAVDVPGERVGEGPLPLRPGGWNVARLAIEGDDVVIGLNGRDVYKRRLDPDAPRTFGLYHDKDRTAAKARKVVLRGRWPESLDAGRLADLLAPRPGAGPSEADRRARHAVIGEDAFSRDAEEVLGRVASLAPGDRYGALLDWVLPTPDHPVVRLAGMFTPADDPAWPGDAPPRARVQTGGELRAPAIALVEAARDSGKLDELASRLAGIQGESARVESGRVALLGLVQLARGDGAGASASLDALGPLLDRADASDLGWLRWAELVLASRASARPDARAAALRRLDAAVGRATSAGLPDPGWLWEVQVRHARAMARASDSPGGDAAAIGASPDPAPGWSSTSHPAAMARGRGVPPSGWVDRDGTLAHQPGRGNDLLFLDTPLGGDFRVDCEINLAANFPVQLSYGGVAAGPKSDPGTSEQAAFGKDSTTRPVTPPLERPADGWAAASLESRGGQVSVTFAGRTLHEWKPPGGQDPWFALRSNFRGEGSVRKLKIGGNPTIPEELDLSSFADLAGWSAQEYNETIGGTDGHWQKQGNEIIARGPAEKGGPVEESVLRYHRPMREDGEISYEFYYAPGKATTGPALGRVAFLPGPDGVTVHRLTDAPFERAGLAVDNAEAGPEDRRGPAPLPLRPDAWNAVTLKVEGDVVSVALNGQPASARPIEPNNPRTFGFFRLAGRDEARVRNVRYRGAWPRSVPASLRADR